MIKGIIFDLGGTLLHFTGDRTDVTREGAEAMITWYLKKRHIKLDGEALTEAFLAERATNLARAKETQKEILAVESLTDALDKINAQSSTKALAEAAVKVFFGPEEAAWQCFPDTIDTVKQLKAQGYRLGLYSNATDDKLVQRLVNRNRLRPLLAPTFSSAGCGWRKPKADAFALIAKRWALPPEQIVVIGNSVAVDIQGAHNADMRSVLATMDEASSQADNGRVQPTATIQRLSELPDLIKQI